MSCASVKRGLSGQAIHTPTFRRFARIDSKKMPIVEALRQIRANRVFSSIRIELRVVRVQSTLLSHFLEGRFAKMRFFSKRESIHREYSRFACESRIDAKRIGPGADDTQAEIVVRSLIVLTRLPRSYCV